VESVDKKSANTLFCTEHTGFSTGANRVLPKHSDFTHLDEIYNLYIERIFFHQARTILTAETIRFRAVENADAPRTFMEFLLKSNDFNIFNLFI
jgi:hypothetical protein